MIPVFQRLAVLARVGEGEGEHGRDRGEGFGFDFDGRPGGGAGEYSVVELGKGRCGRSGTGDSSGVMWDAPDLHW